MKKRPVRRGRLITTTVFLLRDRERYGSFMQLLRYSTVVGLIPGPFQSAREVRELTGGC